MANKDTYQIGLDLLSLAKKVKEKDIGHIVLEIFSPGDKFEQTIQFKRFNENLKDLCKRKILDS